MREFQDNPSLLKELAEDEKIAWRGAPEAFPLLTEENKRSITGRWLGCIIAAVALIAVYLVIALGTGQGLSVWLLILVLVVVAYYAYIPVIDKNNVYKKCKYYITDRRIIMHYGENEMFTLPLAGLKSEIVPGEDGCIHIDLGASVGVRGKKRRVAAFVPKKDDNGNVCGMVLYNVADCEQLRAIFNK